MTLDIRSPNFWKLDDVDRELRRVYDVCGGCRRCLPLCPSFKVMFDRMDVYAVDGDVDKLLAADVKEVGDPVTGVPVGKTELNLKSAIEGETYEYTQMYPGMAKTAREEGYAELAEWFETLAKAEKSHAGRFTKGFKQIAGKDPAEAI